MSKYVKEDKDKKKLWNKQVLEWSKLNGSFITTGVHEDQPEKVITSAVVNEFGMDDHIITSKQAYYMVKVLYGLDPKGDRDNFWGLWKHLKGSILRIPARPFIGGAFDHYLGVPTGLFIDFMDGIKTGQFTAREGLMLLAQKITVVYVGYYDSVKEPGNAPLTIKVKGFDKPLFHKGKLKRAIKSKVFTK